MAAGTERADQPPRSARRTSPLTVSCAFILPPLAYVLVWSSIGQLSVLGGWRQISWIHPLPPRQVEVVAGTIAGILFVPAVYILIWNAGRGRLVKPWPMLIVLVTVYAGWTAFVGRVVTAETFGANIGGGLLIFAQVPVTIATIATVAIVLVRLRRTHPNRPQDR